MKPYIYVADLAAYNDGDLRGEWIDATLDSDDIQAEIDSMLEKSTGEEWAIHDYDDFGGIELREHESLDKVSMIANLIVDIGDEFIALYLYDDYLADDYHGWKTIVEDSFNGVYDSMLDYAYEFLEDTGAFNNADPMLANYFNYQAYARDLEMELTSVYYNGKQFIYSLY